MTTARRHALVISLAPVGREMAGTGIRAYELARALAPHVDVTLAAPAPAGEPVDDVPVTYYELRDPDPLRDPIRKADAVVAQPQWPLTSRWLARSGTRLIFDLYDPEPFELSEGMVGRNRLLRSLVYTLTLDRILEALHIGHHFICATDKQRDLWIGAMLGARLLGPETYDRDPSLRSVIDEVPFGLDPNPARVTGPGVRERFAPDIGPDDEVVLWNGGIWNWLDPTTPIRAMAILAQRRPGARLVFMGADSGTPAKKATALARDVAAELGLLDRTVFFNDTWVPYGERASWLLQANCAVSTHVDHLETQFAFRTRLLDCFWAGLPIVCTRGDELAAYIERVGLGETVPEGDAEALAAALDSVLERDRSAYAEAFGQASADFAWPRVAEPLIRYVTDEELPPRLGSAAHRPAGPRLRASGFRAAFNAMNAVGIRAWPRI
jgi:glycosyltransferase involved in cell wall biosynthesis